MHGSSDVGRRIGRTEMNPVPTMSQFGSNGCSHGGFSHTALPHRHDHTLSSALDLVNQCGQRGAQTAVPVFAEVGTNLQFRAARIKDTPKSRHADWGKRQQGDFDAWQFRQPVRHCRQGLLSSCLQRTRSLVAGGAGNKDSVHRQNLATDAHFSKFPTRAFGLCQGR